MPVVQLVLPNKVVLSAMGNAISVRTISLRPILSPAVVLVDIIVSDSTLLVNPGMLSTWLLVISVGSTSNEFKGRFRNHKSAMLTSKNTCEVPIHFNREQYVLSNFNFTIIKEICNASDNNLEQRLTTREAHWTAQLCTLQPHGLNKRCEFNSTSRIRYN